jgi:hypothetical protein
MIASTHDRRRFLRYSLATAGAAAASAASPLWLPWADAAALAEARQAPAPPRASHPAPPPAQLVRVRGHVRAGRRGLPGVAMSDGVSVTTTDKDGKFELVSSPDAIIRCSIPGDYEIATSPTGTARFYQPVIATPHEEVQSVFELQPRRDSAERHQFLVLADPQTQTRAETGYFNDETVPDVQALLKSRAGVPTFGVGCGDLMFDDLSLFPEYERGVTAMGVPFFQVIGNHDLDLLGRSDETASRTFLDRFGPTYYSFNVGAIHYVVLDDVMWHGSGYIGYVDERQLKWLEADLAQIERGRTVVVFTHVPLLCTQHRRLKQPAPSVSQVVTNRLAIYRLLEGYKAHVMSGHTHENEHVLEQGVHEHIHGAVCGAWWTGPVCFDGTPKGYGVYEVRGEELRWHYKSTGQPSTHQMRIYAPGSDPKQPGVLIANVWNWDPKWQVAWYEDGEQRPPMEQYTGQDPQSVSLYGGPTLPATRQWVEPMTTNHLFRCSPAATAREVRIEAIDPFGTRYTETWRTGTA